MFTLLKVPKVYANGGICHLREDGSLTKELFSEDADLISELDDDVYAFFIIEAENKDTVKYDRFQHRLFASDFNENDIYLSSNEVSEMCHILLKDGAPLPNNIENLLKDKLTVFFSDVIQFESNGFNSSSVLENYEWILKYIGKNVNSYVLQSTIDNFINLLSSKHEIEQIEKISKSTFIDISLESIELYLKAKEELDYTVAMVKEFLSSCYCNTNIGKKNVTSSMFVLKNTPCGKVKICVKIEQDNFVVLISMDNKNYSKTVIDISGQCQDIFNS